MGPPKIGMGQPKPGKEQPKTGIGQPQFFSTAKGRPKESIFHSVTERQTRKRRIKEPVNKTNAKMGCD